MLFAANTYSCQLYSATIVWDLSIFGEKGGGSYWVLMLYRGRCYPRINMCN